MKPTLLATTILLFVLAVASVGCIFLRPQDMVAWTISEVSTILAITFAYFYRHHSA